MYLLLRDTGEKETGNNIFILSITIFAYSLIQLMNPQQINGGYMWTLSSTVSRVYGTKHLLHYLVYRIRDRQSNKQQFTEHTDSVTLNHFLPFSSRSFFYFYFLFFWVSEKSKRPPESVLIFHYPQGRYMRAIKYSYRGSSHLWKLWEISAAEKDLGKQRDKV